MDTVQDIWNDMTTASKAYRERGDCTVKALALVTDKSYGEAWDTLSRAGRIPRRGIPRIRLNQLIERLGHKVDYIRPFKPSGGRYTPKTIGNRCHTGKYLCYTRSHVLTVIDGQVVDWTEGRKHRITMIIKID